jgi:hypothetical protein
MSCISTKKADFPDWSGNPIAVSKVNTAGQNMDGARIDEAGSRTRVVSE